MKKRKNKMFILIALLVLFTVSIGYALINRVLLIRGNSTIDKSTWDIHFENLIVNQGSVTADTPIIDNDDDTVNFNVMLNLPGDYYQFTVDIVNDGTMDAEIATINKTPTLFYEQTTYFNYEIRFASGEEIGSKRIIPAGDFVRIKVSFKYDSSVSEENLPTTQQEINLGFEVNCIQSDGNGALVHNKGVKADFIADGSLDTIGTVVTIGDDFHYEDENFYVIGTEGDNVKLLAKYGLAVGNDSSYEEVNGEKVYTIVPSYSIYDGQLSSYPYEENEETCVTDFGVNSPLYEESLVKGYVDDYKRYLENFFGINIVDARLISKEELENPNTFNCRVSQGCSTEYPWLYVLSYWTGNANTTDGVYAILRSNNYLSGDYKNRDGGGYNVRPVIVVPKADIKIQQN